MGKIYTRFWTKAVQKPYPLGWHIPICLYKRVTPRAARVKPYFTDTCLVLTPCYYRYFSILQEPQNIDCSFVGVKIGYPVQPFALTCQSLETT